jgi:transcriptional regulator with XRE-family HTH domain
MRTATDLAPVGKLFRYWRHERRMSQLALAVAADVSPRHVCFLETGRARPSREMILRLADTLDVPFRERNALFLAAGFAPMYGELDLEAPQMAPARAALEAILQQQEPYPAIVMNRHWDIVLTNRGAARFFSLLLGDRGAAEPANVVRLVFSPTGLRPSLVNWEEVAESLIGRVHREAVGGVIDEETTCLLHEALAVPDVPDRWRTLSLDRPTQPLIPLKFRHNGRTFSYFSTVTTLGTPQDITLQEIRIECFFPTDPETRRHAHDLALDEGESRA